MYTVLFNDGTIEIQLMKDSLYRQGFVNNLFQRKSCCSCEYQRIPRIADFSAGDIFNCNENIYRNILTRLDSQNNMGVSFVSINSNKGKKIFNEYLKNMLYVEVINFDLLKPLHHYNLPPKYNKNRKKFFDEFSKSGFKKAAKKYVKYNKVKSFIRRVLSKIKRTIIKK